MRTYLKFAIITLTMLAGMGLARTEEGYVKRVTDYVRLNIKPWLSDPIVVNSVKGQNVEYSKLTNYEINKMDNGWIDRSDKQLIDSKMNNDLSAFLRKKKDAGKGIIFEIFVFDAKGLNVGQTDLTQDFNQGDEAKYWKTYQVGPDAIFVDNPAQDNGRNISQASLTIKDPSTGKAIGAVTVGIDLDKLK